MLRNAHEETVYSPFSLATFVAPHKPLSSQAVVMVETWLHALDIKSCWRVIATVVLNGRLCKQHKRAATYPNTNTDTGRYEKTGLERTQSV